MPGQSAGEIPRGPEGTHGLRPYRGARDDPVPPEGGRTAAVAVVLRPGTDSPEVLLIERSRVEGDPWSGQMALPGGRRDATDRSLLETAVRETREETGVALDAYGRALGRLDSVEPQSVHLPRLTVLPLVFLVGHGTVAGEASAEVARTLWAPLDHLRNRRNRRVHRHRSGGRIHSFPAIDVEGQPVWGLTRRILIDLLERLP